MKSGKCENLLERTDDEHMLNASELCTILDQEYGISMDRRTIYTEMEILDKFGLDIQQKKGKCPGYYIGARDFELPELKLLVDAVQSSKFITEKKSKELIQKLEKLCCKTDAEMLSSQSGNGSIFIYPGQIPGEKIERTSLIVICGEMVAKLATIDDTKIYSTEYYRIYVKNYIVYYVVIDDEGPDKITEVRRFLYNK